MNPPSLKKELCVTPIQIVSEVKSSRKSLKSSNSQRFNDEKFGTDSKKLGSQEDNDNYLAAAYSLIKSPEKMGWFRFFDDNNTKKLTPDVTLISIIRDSNILGRSGNEKSNDIIMEMSADNNLPPVEMSYSTSSTGLNNPGECRNGRISVAVSTLKPSSSFISPSKVRWNIDASTQTGDSLKLNGRKKFPTTISYKWGSCVIS